MSIKTGAVLTAKFMLPSSDTFSGYMNYIDRDEAIRNDSFNKFNAFTQPGHFQSDL